MNRDQFLKLFVHFLKLFVPTDCRKKAREDNAVLDEARSLLTKKQVECLNGDIDDMEYICDCEFVDKPKGEHQRNPIYEEWVDQISIGDSGDSWTGEVYIKLSNGKYIKYHYDC